MLTNRAAYGEKTVQLSGQKRNGTQAVPFCRTITRRGRVSRPAYPSRTLLREAKRLPYGICGRAYNTITPLGSPKGIAKVKKEPNIFMNEKQKEAGNRFLSFYMVEDKMKKMKNCYLQVL